MLPKFYADENVPVMACKALQQRGVDILTTQDARMMGKSDHHQLLFAIEHQRALITHDPDFLELIPKEKIEHYGLIFFTQQVSIGKAIEEIEKINLLYSAEEIMDVIFFVPSSNE